MSNKTIVVLGGGVGGITAANELRSHLSSEHRIILVERNREHSFAPSYLWVMTGDRQPQHVSVHLKTLLRPGVDLIITEVKRIDVSARQVKTESRLLSYDYLITALGAELAPETIPGLAEGGHTFYTLPGSSNLHETLHGFTGGTIAVVVAGLPYKCPGAPHEGAMLIADYIRRKHLQHASEVHLFTPEPQPMPVAGPQLGKMVEELLASKGIRFHSLHRLTSVSSADRELVFDNQSRVHYDLLVAIPPHRGPEVVRLSGLANEAGWIPVDRRTLATRHENAFALGDVSAISIPGRWKADVPMMLPKAGVFAHSQARTVAKRIAAAIKGEDSEDIFCGDGYCMLEAGEDLAGFAFGDFFAEPAPRVNLKRVGKSWHLGKVLFEKWWLAPFGLRRTLLQTMIRLGAKVYSVPDVL